MQTEKPTIRKIKLTMHARYYLDLRHFGVDGPQIPPQTRCHTTSVAPTPVAAHLFASLPLCLFEAFANRITQSHPALFWYLDTNGRLLQLCSTLWVKALTHLHHKFDL